MKLFFTHLHLENFMSFEEADVDLSGNGFVLVTGENRNVSDGASSNGSGKSTVFEAIYWCLTGNTIRGSKEVVNNQFKDNGCYVELEATIDGREVNIIRAKDHKKYKTNLIVTVDGHEITSKGIRDSQKAFSEMFPEISSDLIGSVIVLGQGLPNRFTSNTPSGRKQVLEQLTDSEFMIDSLKIRVNGRETEINSSISDKRLDISSITGKKEVLKRSIDSLVDKRDNSNKEALKTLLSTKQARYDEQSGFYSDVMSTDATLREKSDRLYKELVEKKSELSGLYNYSQTEVNKVVEEYSPLLVELSSEISSLSSYILKAESIRDVCPTCGQKLVGVEKIDCSGEREKLVLASEKKSGVEKEKEDKICAIKKAYSEKTAAMQEAVNEVQVLYKSVQDEMSRNNSRKKNIESELMVLSKEIENLKIELAKEDIDYESEIAKLQEEIKTLDKSVLYINNEIETLNSHLAVIKKFQTYLKRDFRGYLLNQYIEFMNSVAKKYCSMLFNSSDISICLDGNNLSISYGDKEYEALSGGERQKIDLLVQFSIRDMLKSTLNFSSNILVLDEITDNLDAEGCHRLIDFVASAFKDLDSIYLVSHRRDLDIPYDITLNVVKGEDGVSRIE